MKERIHSAVTVMDTISVEGPGSCQRLHADHSPPLAADETPYWDHLVPIHSLLDGASRKLIAAVGRYHLKLSELGEPRDRRDRTFDELGDLVLGMRNTCEGLYVVDDLASLGFPKKIARDPKTLLEQSDRLEEQFNGDDAEMPELRFENLKLKPADLVEQVTGKATELRQALGDLEARGEEAEALRLDMCRTADELDRVFAWGASAAESLFNLADEPELAARVKPSVERPGRTEQKPVTPLPPEILEALYEPE